MWVKKNNNKIEFDVLFCFLNPWLEQAKQRREILKEKKKKKKATLSREQGQRSTVGHSREV